MKHVIYRWIMDYEKEEKWLNEMASKGLNFSDFSFPGRYTFVEGIPGEYVYRLEFLNKTPANIESQSYIKFVESTGAEMVGSYLRWIWFRKKATEGPFVLYSDNISKINHYKRIVYFIGIIGGLNISCGLFNLFYGLFIMGPKFHIYFNAIISPISFFIGIACGFVIRKYIKSINKLKKENQVME